MGRLVMLLLWLLLRTGFVHSSHDGYVVWSDGSDEDVEISTRQHHARGAAAGAEELPRVVAAFLHTGDASALGQVNCSRRYELSGLGSAPPAPHVASFHSVRSALDAAARSADFLKVLTWEVNQEAPQKQRQQLWYRALLRSTLEREPRIHRAALSIGTEHLQASRNDERVVVRDLSVEEYEWYHEFRKRARVITQGRSSETLPKSPVQWSAPYLECEQGQFVPHWLLTLSVGIYGLNSNAEPEIRGAVRVDVNLQDVDIDQCSSTGWFAGTHRCNLTTTECKPIPGHGFVLDKYKCQCKRGFYQHSRVTLNGFSKLERDHYAEPSEVPGLCLPCQEGCSFCQDDSPCLAQEDRVLRLAVVLFQGLCVLLDVISMALVYHFRHKKRIKASGFILLEAILFGAVLLYFPVLILYFHPDVLHCILLRWVRLLGFATVYGTVILKLYRVLKVFLSRTAQRIPYMTSWHVLRLLGAILLVVLWFLVAWTSATFQRIDAHRGLIELGVTPEGLQFSMCLLDRWDYMMAVAEFLFLLWGVYLCYAVRSVPSAFHEPRYMAIAIYNELLISAIFHIIRFTLAPGLHPDWMLMLFFVHTHLTVTVTLGLLLIPKFLFTSTHTRDDIATEAYEDELDMGRSGSYLNSSITSAWSEHSLDPEDIREELKKLYSQLEVYKRKKMLANNPHLQKKRNSKKGIGRTLMRRITEIPETMSRQYSREERDGSEHGSNRSTLRRNPFEPGKPREESLKSKMFSLKRSHSFDHAHNQGENESGVPPDKMESSNTELSLLGTLMGRRSAKKNPEAAKVEPAESAESVPLFCKSISAHNLAADKKPVHLRSSVIQKSLSVIASARERTLGLAGKTHSVEDASKKGLKARDTRMLSEVDESPEHFPKMIISQSVEYTKTPSKMGIMKQQVSGSQPSICSEPGRSKDLYDLSEVCPWELEELPTPSEGRTQKHVSIAPSETNTIHEGKTGWSQKQRTTVQSPSNRRRSRDKGSTKEEPGDKCEGRKLRSPHKADVCPWEFEDSPLKGMESGGLSLDRMSRKKSVTPTDEKPKIILSDISKSTGSLLLPPALMADVCPWDYDQPTFPNQDKTSSPTHHPKRRDSSSKRKGSCSSKGKGKDRDDDKQQPKSKERRSSEKRSSQSSDSGQVTVTASGRRRSSTKEVDGKRPWETDRRSSVSARSKNVPAEDKQTSFGGSKVDRVEVRPWDFEEKTMGNTA